MIRFHKISQQVKYEKLIDFAKESNTIDSEIYYMKPSEIIGHRNIPLYVTRMEEVTTIYFLTTSTSDWIRENLPYTITNRHVELSSEFMAKFELIRVIPAGGIPPNDSFQRVVLKKHHETARSYSIEDEMYGEGQIN